jgi:hypothetical protein
MTIEPKNKNRTFITREKKDYQVIVMVLELIGSLSHGNYGMGVAKTRNVFVLNLN